MTAYETLLEARSAERPTASAYIKGLFRDTMELHGDRRFADDGAVIGGIARFEGIPVTYIAIEKGATMEERLSHNFGCPHPEGYRKALRLMEQAEKFRRPVICLVDTSGAACDEEAENRGQGQSIAENLARLMSLETPVISVVIGEGGSGGALALAVADRVYMLEGAVYSVISPEGCATILWHDAAMAATAAESLAITAADCARLGICEEVVPERRQGLSGTLKALRGLLARDLTALCAVPVQKLLADRYARYRRFGAFATKA